PVLLENPLAPILIETETETETEKKLTLSTPLLPEQNQISDPDLIELNEHVINQLPQRLEDDQQAILAIIPQKSIRKDFPRSLELGPYIAYIHPLDEENA